jgi:flagellar M-ring protein FliF
MRLSAIAAVALGLIAFFTYLTARLSSPGMALLYSDLDIADSGQIVAQLEAMNVPYQLRGEGRQIMVPANRALRLRMAMAEEGLPSGGSVGYEIFDNSDTLGATNFMMSVNRVRALEGELARTISSLSTVGRARVHLVLPERELFSRTRQEPSASIVLKLRGAVRLAPQQVSAIQHLVAAAVPRLAPSGISIVDDQGNLLARGSDGEGVESLGGMTSDEVRSNYENRLAGEVEEMVERVVGLGKVRVRVSAQMDFDRIVTNSESFDPDGQVVRSTDSVEETEASADSEGEQPVTVETNLPIPAGPGAAAPGSTSQRSSTSEVVNYEISKKVISHVRNPGTVSRLSVAVLIDGEYEPAADGAPPAYKPRAPEQLEQLDRLVRSAIGFDVDRGDTLEIVNMPFTAPPPVEDDSPSGLLGLQNQDLVRLAEILVLAVTGILVVLFVVRPLIGRAFTLGPPRRGDGGGTLPHPMLTDQRAVTAGLVGPAQELPEGANPTSELEELINLNQVEGRVRVSSLKKLGEIVDKHPEEALAIIRTWMHQEA